MPKIALAFSSKDRPELSVRTIEPLLNLPDTKLFWVDGSIGDEGKGLPYKTQLVLGENHNLIVHPEVRGGADAAIVYALTIMLKGSDFKYVGLVENDVLLHEGWFDRTMALFERGREDGLEVGAVSARCYEDRILCQRDGYALMHNLGAGMVIFTSQAARLILDHFRTTWTTENRKLFAQLTGRDIGAWWAFRAGEHWLTADWGFDKILASYGFASLALTPSPCDMLDIAPEKVGLSLVRSPNKALCWTDLTFENYVERTAATRLGKWITGNSVLNHCADGGTRVMFPHHLSAHGATYTGAWRLKWQQGFGPFAWRAVPNAGEGTATFEMPVLGPCGVMLGGGPNGGFARVIDLGSGFEVQPELPPEGDQTSILAIDVPASVSYRTIRVEALSPGVTFYGLRVRDPQPWLPDVHFDYSALPPV